MVLGLISHEENQDVYKQYRKDKSHAVKCKLRIEKLPYVRDPFWPQIWTLLWFKPPLTTDMYIFFLKHFLTSLGVWEYAVHLKRFTNLTKFIEIFFSIVISSLVILIQGVPKNHANHSWWVGDRFTFIRLHYLFNLYPKYGIWPLFWRKTCSICSDCCFALKNSQNKSVDKMHLSLQS